MHYFKHFIKNPVYQFRINVEPRINTTFNGQPAYITEYSIAFFTDREAIISINMQQDNIVTNIYSISFIPLTVNETSAVWQTILQCIQSGNNYINVEVIYLNSEGEPVAVEPSQPTISGSPESPDPTSDHNSTELNYIPISPPSPIPFSDDSM